MDTSSYSKPCLELKGCLTGHKGWVTQLTLHPSNPNILLSSSRDKTIMAWELRTNYNEDIVGGRPIKSLVGHGHFVSDMTLSNDGQYVLSGSWDKTLRLWDLSSGISTRQFLSHTKDVLSVAFSADNRQIVSGSRDKTIKLWNTLATCKLTLNDRNECHSDWVSSVRFSYAKTPSIVSGSWDKTVKVWNLSKCTLKTNHVGHTGIINCLTISPDGSLCASGGKDGAANLWDLNVDRHVYLLPSNGVINALAFSPSRYWLCAAVGPTIKIWDLEVKTILDELNIDSTDQVYSRAECTSLTWSADGNTLFAGYTDNLIRIYAVSDNIKKKRESCQA